MSVATKQKDAKPAVFNEQKTEMRQTHVQMQFRFTTYSFLGRGACILPSKLLFKELAADDDVLLGVGYKWEEGYTSKQEQIYKHG